MKHCPNPECPDFLDNGRPGEYRDDVERCAYCGAPLAWGPAPEAEPAAAPVDGRLPLPAEAVAVAAYPTRAQAELARGFLEACGIPAEVRGDDAGATRPELGLLTGGVRVVVPAGRAEEAAALLEEAEREG